MPRRPPRPPKPPAFIEKAVIVEHLHALGRHEDAIRADVELDDRVLTAQDSVLLMRFGIDPNDIAEDTFRNRPPTDY